MALRCCLRASLLNRNAEHRQMNTVNTSQTSARCEVSKFPRIGRVLTDDEMDTLATSVPSMLSWKTIRSTFALDWLEHAQHGSEGREQYLSQQAQTGLVWALLLTVACAGLFGIAGVDQNPHAEDYWLGSISHLNGFFWCSSFIALGLATFSTVLFSMGAGSTNTENEFKHYIDMMGKFCCRLPLVYGMYGSVAIFFGLIAYIALVWSTKYTYCCLSVCGLLIPPTGYTLVKLSHVLQIVELTSEAVREKRQQHCDADEIYDALRAYFIEEKKGKLGELNRDEFLEGFGSCTSSVTRLLATKIYDDWLDKKITSMLRDDPGF